MTYIPIPECEHGRLYRLSSRNLRSGVYNSETRGFVGLREKFGTTCLFTEYHYDTGPPFGTAYPIEATGFLYTGNLAEVFIEGSRVRLNRDLYEWIEQQEQKGGDNGASAT